MDEEEVVGPLVLTDGGVWTAQFNRRLVQQNGSHVLFLLRKSDEQYSLCWPKECDSKGLHLVELERIANQRFPWRGS